MLGFRRLNSLRTGNDGKAPFPPALGDKIPCFHFGKQSRISLHIPALILCVLFDYFQLFSKFKNDIKLELNIWVEAAKASLLLTFTWKFQTDQKITLVPHTYFTPEKSRVPIVLLPANQLWSISEETKGKHFFYRFPVALTGLEQTNVLDEHSSFTPAWMTGRCLNYPSLMQGYQPKDGVTPSTKR